MKTICIQAVLNPSLFLTSPLNICYRTQHNPGNIKVTLGDYILNSDLEGMPSETFGVDEVKVHPKFRFTPQADRFDVAVLLLDKPVSYRFNMKPICLPEKGMDFLGSVAFAAGWGALEAGKKFTVLNLL